MNQDIAFFPHPQNPKNAPGESNLLEKKIGNVCSVSFVNILKARGSCWLVSKLDLLRFLGFPGKFNFVQKIPNKQDK